MSAWSPDAYLRFGDERTRPSVDLVSRIFVDDPHSVIDLGCGPGNSTQVLRERWPLAAVVGLDSSADMIAAAREAYADQDWMLGDIATWTPDASYDVVFSNAALQWVPDHMALIPRLMAAVAAGGALAFQVPSRDYSLVRSLIEEVADDSAWADRMDAPRGALTLEAATVYYDALSPLARSVDLWETTYHHVMDSPLAIVEWISSTGLRPFLDALDDEPEPERFTQMLAERVAESYESRSDGRVLFPFKRTFVVAYA